MRNQRRRSASAAALAPPTAGRGKAVITAAVIVAHPDDEVLWCGGFILQRPRWNWHVLSLCRGSDPDRASRFEEALQYLGARGSMGDLDDGPQQKPLDRYAVRNVIREGLPQQTYDFLLTHGPNGEYTQHRRHAECSQSVVELWTEGHLEIDRLMLFAYGDSNGALLPRALKNADELYQLDDRTLDRKRHLITHIYGFDETSWEAKTNPSVEGFVGLGSPDQFKQRILAG